MNETAKELADRPASDMTFRESVAAAIYASYLGSDALRVGSFFDKLAADALEDADFFITECAEQRTSVAEEPQP